ncbi:MAG: citramalate synthase [Chitinivibrionales bacterium]|nr:citramalate synthase [Chitinivibrionales bacterium]
MGSLKNVSIYDTTLRDGNQGRGINFSLSDKLRIAQKLSDLGIHYIEGGWPNPTNPIDSEFYKKVQTLSLRSKVAAFGSTKRPGTKVDQDEFLAMVSQAPVPVATIFGKSSELHVKKVLHCSLTENIDMIAESIWFLKKKKDEVIFDAEHFFDGYLLNPDYAMKTLEAARDSGADTIVLCDTNGGTLTSDFQRIVTEVRSRFNVPLGLHLHNDCGCADANSMLGIELGATQVQGTMNGLGERCGNANLCTVIAGLQLKRGCPILPEAQIKNLTETSIFVSEIANIAHDSHMPYVGQSAFSHKAGAHIDAVMKAHESFEHIRPEVVGNKRQFLISSQAGKSTVWQRLQDVAPNIDKNDPMVKNVLQKLKTMESEGYHFEAAEGSFQLIVHTMLNKKPDAFAVKGFRIITEQRDNGEISSEATIKVEEDGIMEHTAADGDGPVNALDNALRKALVKFFPSLREVTLEDYKVRVLEEKQGTAACVRVLIESSDGKRRWGTTGVSTNIIEASWLALIDSLKYKLMLDEQISTDTIDKNETIDRAVPTQHLVC